MTLLYIIGYGIAILFIGFLCGGNRALDDLEGDQ